jgi:Tol biopolymer transport system component
MTAFDRIEPRMPELMAELAQASVPDYFDDMLREAGRTRQRPAWASLGRWLPVDVVVRPAVTRPPALQPFLVLLLIGLIVVAGVVLYAGTRRTTLPELPFRNGAIVYAQGGDLFIADQLGGVPRALVDGPDDDWYPDFSPRGDRIAFVRSTPGGEQLMSVNSDGSDVRMMTFGGAESFEWSPDGRSLLVTTFNREPEWYETRVVNTDGSGSRTLVAGGHGTQAAWRPNGEQIVFSGVLDGAVHDGDKTPRTYIADADGTNVRELAIGSVGLFPGLTWSPDGRHLAFMTVDGTERGPISVADIDEEGAVIDLRPVKVDREPFDPLMPRWSPDGSQLALLLSNDRQAQIGVVNADGSGYRTVWSNPPEGGAVRDYAWSPDGRSLVISEAPEIDEGGQVVRPASKAWTMDVVTGEQTQVEHPVESWQRLSP